MERWQKEQREDIHRMVEEAKEHIDESGFTTKADWIPNLVWMRWVERYICNRFEYMLRWGWAEAFAMLENEHLFCGIHDDKALLYLRFVRDYARRYVHDGGLE